MLNQKNHEKFVKFCLHSSYTVQKSLHFEDIFFHRKFQKSNFAFCTLGK